MNDIATITGLVPGLTLSDVEQKMGALIHQPNEMERRGPGTSEYWFPKSNHSVLIHTKSDNPELVEFIRGPTLEFKGEVALEAGMSSETVLKILGQEPDSVQGKRRVYWKYTDVGSNSLNISLTFDDDFLICIQTIPDRPW